MVELSFKIFERLFVRQIVIFFRDHEWIVSFVVKEIMRRSSVHDQIVFLIVPIPSIGTVLVDEILSILRKLESDYFFSEIVSWKFFVDFFVKVFTSVVTHCVLPVPKFVFLTDLFAFGILEFEFHSRETFYVVEQIGILRLCVKHPAPFSILGIDGSRQPHDSRYVSARVIWFDLF